MGFFWSGNFETVFLQFPLSDELPFRMDFLICLFYSVFGCSLLCFRRGVGGVYWKQTQSWRQFYLLLQKTFRQDCRLTLVTDLGVEGFLYEAVLLLTWPETVFFYHSTLLLCSFCSLLSFTRLLVFRGKSLPVWRSLNSFFATIIAHSIPFFRRYNY